MELYDSIARRKSCRSYNMAPLEPQVFDEIAAAISAFETLTPDYSPIYRFTDKTKGRFRVEAPHYVIIGGKKAPGESENIGFLFEQLALWFDANDLGCVWLGGAKDAGRVDAGDVITIGFGRAAESPHRELGEFKRKPIEQITNATDDACIKAAHLAPSGMNTQPWYFEKQGGKVLVYEQKLKPPVSLIYKHSDIDMGIGLCHYALACKRERRPFRFSRAGDLPQKSGYRPFGVIE